MANFFQDWWKNYKAHSFIVPAVIKLFPKKDDKKTHRQAKEETSTLLGRWLIERRPISWLPEAPRVAVAIFLAAVLDIATISVWTSLAQTGNDRFQGWKASRAAKKDTGFGNMRYVPLADGGERDDFSLGGDQRPAMTGQYDQRQGGFDPTRTMRHVPSDMTKTMPRAAAPRLGSDA